jgi:hypothetical protein
MARTINYYRELSNNQKGAWLCSVLKIQLTVKNFIVATPEPDNGDDIWFSKGNQENYVIYPAQVKSSFSIETFKTMSVRRYRFTISQPRLERSFQREYFYFLGLYNPETDNFQIGCFPSSFFEGHWEFLLTKRSPTLSDGRKKINIEMDYHFNDRQYYAFVKGINVTEYFKSWDLIV